MDNLLKFMIRPYLIFNDNGEPMSINMRYFSAAIKFYNFFNKYDTNIVKKKPWIVQKFFLFLSSYYTKEAGKPLEFKFPLTLTVSLTDKCSTGCSFCYSKSTFDKNNFIEIKTIENIASSPTPYIIITGGEPFLHPNLEKILEILIKAKKYVIIATNASENEIKPIAKKFGDNIEFLFSIYGNELEHNLMRGENNYAQSISAISTVNKYKCRCTINCLIVNNINSFLSIIPFIDKWKIDRIVITRLKKIHNNKDNYSKINPIEKKRIINNRFLIKYYAKMKNVFVLYEEDDMFSLFLENNTFLTKIKQKSYSYLSITNIVNKCGAGILTLHVNSSGEIQNCFLKDQNISKFNINIQPFSEIWNEIKTMNSDINKIKPCVNANKLFLQNEESL